MRQWHILTVASGTDARVEKDLSEIGIVALSLKGTKETVHRRSKRKLTKRYSLFPGYVFALLDLSDANEWVKVKRVRGCHGAVRSDGGTGMPAVLPSRDIATLIQAERDGVFNSANDAQLFGLGDDVTFDFGDLLSEISAVVTKVEGRDVTVESNIAGKRIVATRQASELRAA